MPCDLAPTPTRAAGRPSYAELASGMARGLVARGASASAASAATIGAAYLAAWLVGAAARWSASGVLTMKANMAASLTSAGLSLWLVQPRMTTPRRRVVGAVLAAVVFLVGAMTLCEHVLQTDFGIDQLLASEAPGALATGSPNRLGPPGAVSLALLGAALLALAWQRRVASYFALGAAVIMLVPAVGYVSGVVQFYRETATGIAWLTVIGLLLLCAGIHLAEGPDGPLGLVFREEPGGRLLRSLLPAALVAPVILQVLMRIGNRAGLYGHTTGVGILLVSFVVVIGGLLWRGASRLSTEAARARDAEQRAVSLARLPEESPDPVLRLSRDFDAMYANAAGQSLLADLGAVLGGRAPPVLVEFARRALAEGTRAQGEVSAGDRFYSLTVAAVGNDVNVYAHDITTRVHAREALHGAVQRLESLLENSPLAVVEWSSVDFRIARWSDEATRMFGWTADEVVGKRIDELNWVYPEDRPLVEQVMRDMLSGARPRNVNKNRNHRKDGTVIHCEWYNSTVADSAGQLVSVLSLVLDVTERKRIEQELRDANRAKDDFLGMLSHELRNPLAPIQNSLYILDHADPTGHAARRAKEVARRQLKQLTRLVDDLLDVTRIVRGKVELRRTDLDVAELTRRIADDHRTLMSDRGLELDLETPTAPVWVNGDETRLAQVVGNLLQNAAKFTPPGGRVTVSVIGRPGAAEVRVRDTGAGVEPELQADIFNPFVQAKQSLARTAGGLGLGLALVKGLVELHGGTVTVESAGRDRGAMFTVNLPVIQVATSATAEAPATLDARPRSQRRVLVVDDNRDAAESLADLVRMLGHDAAVAFDGESAVRLVAADPPDLVLCDIGLPGMSGYQVAAALRADGRFDSVQLVAISGYAQPEDRQRALDAGFAEHIAKPADPAKVLRVLRSGKQPRPA